MLEERGIPIPGGLEKDALALLLWEKAVKVSAQEIMSSLFLSPPVKIA